MGLLTEWVWKILKTHQKHEQTVGPLTCPLGKRWRLLCRLRYWVGCMRPRKLSKQISCQGFVFASDAVRQNSLVQFLELRLFQVWPASRCRIQANTEGQGAQTLHRRTLAHFRRLGHHLSCRRTRTLSQIVLFLFSLFFVLLFLFPLLSDTETNVMWLGGAEVRKMRAMANHHANPREQCSQMEAPDGNNKRNTRTISFIFVFGFAVGRKYSVASTCDT